MKKKVKSWCRYWHFNVCGLLSDNGGHSNYLNIVSNLDDWHTTDAWGPNEENSLDEVWKIVLSNLNKCDDEQLHMINRLCTSRNY